MLGAHPVQRLSRLFVISAAILLSIGAGLSITLIIFGIRRLKAAKRGRERKRI